MQKPRIGWTSRRDSELMTHAAQGEMAMAPWSERGCTDILLLLLFLAFVGGMIAVGVIGFVR